MMEMNKMTQVTNPQRRNVLRAASAGAMLGGAAPLALGQAAPAASDPWATAQRIIDRFAKPLVFRKEDFPITKFGAKPCKLEQITTTGGDEPLKLSLIHI